MGDWTESKYNETRFGGMDQSVEPHTLDRDGGVMSDEFNMLSRTQGLRVRRGWVPAPGLDLYVSSLPGRPICPVLLIPYEPNITVVPKDDPDGDEGDGDDGGNGGVVPFPGLGDDDETPSGGGGGSSVTLSMTTPQAVVAEVPFTVSANASAQYTGTNAKLKWAFQPDGTPNVSLSKGIRSGWDDNAWSAQATVWTADRSKTNVVATLEKGVAVAATKTMGYSVADMVPALPESIPYRQNFNFTVTCKLGGAPQTGYVGNGRGVSLKWEALDSGDQVVSSHVSVSGETWTDGVGSFTGKLTTARSTAVKLRLTVTYAGGTQTAVAPIAGSGMLTVPSRLHVFAGGSTLRVNAVGFDHSNLAIVAYSGGNAVLLSEYLEMDDGTPFNFASGWEDNVWEHSVRAKSSALAGTLTLKLMQGPTELADEDITIVTAITATIATSPSPIYAGGDLTATATISATGYTITRIPAETVQIVISGETDESGLNDENETEVEASYEDVPSGSIVVQVKDMRDETILASVTIETTSYQTRLVEAINERLTAKNYSSSDLVDEDEVDKSVLYTKGNAAMYGFVDGDISIDNSGNIVYSTFGNSELPAYEGTDDEWYKDAYETVIQAVTRLTNSTSMYPTYIQKRKVGFQYSRDTLESAVELALANCNSQNWEDYPYFDSDGVVTEMSTSYSDGTYKAKAVLKYTGKEQQYREKVACTIDIYAKGNSSFNGTWNTMGHQHVVADKNTTAKIAMLALAANETVTFRSADSEDNAEARYSGTLNTGYQQYSTHAVFATYNFQHK